VTLLVIDGFVSGMGVWCRMEHLYQDSLPTASTCFFHISLPHYSSVSTMREKLEYAISCCGDIDGDYRARDFDVNAGPVVEVADNVDHEADFEDWSDLQDSD